MYSILLILIITLALAQQSSACNGFVLKFHYLKPCGDNNIIVFKNFDATFDKDCNIVLTGSIDMQQFATAIVHYKVQKIPLPPLEGDYNLCKALKEENEYALMAINALTMPQKCPMDKQEIHDNGKWKLDISNYKSKLGLALGVSDVNLTIRHDSGVSCMSLRAEFLKPRRRG